eukprot:CAMPEP_0178576430 /NCGR_PEP_ID=MMETSP0697-20121206/20453_1 /TAXON_ID=265572 /ORGANISM="Extubocellulus spinifer, Strain CCMP396" /LENGTH=556 /DNA_ID=CAMNT_0020211627 /DNA_START=208 /DNA_END=1878 /DNA_ORIENTATION=-
MIHIDDTDDWKGGSLSSITFTDTGYGSHGRTRTEESSDLLLVGTSTSAGAVDNTNRRHHVIAGDDSDTDDEEQIRRYQLGKANAANVGGGDGGGGDGPALPPRPPRTGDANIGGQQQNNGQHQQQQQQKQTKSRRNKGRRQQRRGERTKDTSATTTTQQKQHNERYGDQNRVEITFPDTSEGIPAPGNVIAEPLIEQGDLDCACMCTCLLLILVLPTLLYFYTNLSESWRLHTGASRHVVVASTFTKSVTVRRTAPTMEHGHENEIDTGGMFEAYHVDGRCPPLTGANLTLDHRRNLHLESGAYDWNRYYLNPGSVVNVTVTATSGGFKLFLFRGKTAFESWRHDPSEYNSFFRRSHTYEGLEPAAITHEAVIAEAFYVVYSNPFGRGADVNVDVERSLTTFNLTGVDPLPDEDCNAEGTECLVQLSPWKLACIVVQAQSPRLNKTAASDISKEVQSYTADYAVGEQNGRATDDAVVYVNVDGNHRWTAILTLVIVPAFLLLLVADTGRKDEDEDSHDEDDNDDESSDFHAKKKSSTVADTPAEVSEKTPLTTNVM